MLCSWFLFSPHLLWSSSSAQTFTPRRIRSGIICDADIDPLLFSCSLLVSLPSGQQTFGNVKKAGCWEFHIPKSLLIWVVCSSPEAFCLIKVSRDINSLLTVYMFQKFHHIFVAILISLTGHIDICRKPKKLYIWVLQKYCSLGKNNLFLFFLFLVKMIV